MIQMEKWLRWSLILIGLLANTAGSTDLFDNESDDLLDLIAQESNVNEEFYQGSSYVLPNTVFNDGKPFYVERDPSTGAIDFNHKKTAGSQNHISLRDKLVDGKDSHASEIKDVVINQTTPNFHDFLNLPVKYTSSKFVYPLISSSYANLKYQGNNKLYVSNHKNYTSTTTSTTSPKYYTKPAPTTSSKTVNLYSPTVNVSKKMTSTTSFVPPTTTTRTTTTTTTTTTTKTTPEPSTTITTSTTTKAPFTRYPYKSTIKNKYLDIAETRKKFFFTSSTLALPSTTPPTTTTSTSTTTPPPPTTLSFATSPTSTTYTTYVYTPEQTENYPNPKNPIKFVDDDVPSTQQPTTIKFSMPTIKYENPIGVPSPFKANPFKPLPPTQAQLQLQLKQQNDDTKSNEQKEPGVMSLSEIFNALSTTDTSNEQNSYQYETTNVIEQTTPPAIVLIPQQNEQYYTNKPQDVSNHYVKYDVQQQSINRVPFQQIPSMNNIIISPDQHSASFVLGSQQSVGSGGHYVGSVAPKPASAALSQTYQLGSVFDEPKEAQKTMIPSVSIQVQPQDFIKTSSVRFPSESDDKYENAPIVTGTFKSEILSPNGHSAPISMQQNQMVVFPPNDNLDNTLHEVSNRIVFDTPINEVLNKNEVTHEVTLNGQMNYQQPSEQLTPPTNNHPENMQMMMQTRPPPPPAPSPNQQTPFVYKELLRRPYPSDRPRPPIGGLLPNILPQFRPNAKISHGHPYNKEAGTVRVPSPQHYNPSRKPPPAPISIRRTPLPTRFMSRINTAAPLPSPPIEHMENRRHYRVPPPLPFLKDRIFNIQPPRNGPPPRFIDGYPTMEKHSNVNVDHFEQIKTEPEDNEFHRNPPALLKSKQEVIKKPASFKLEPVVTLQMLQMKKTLSDTDPHKLNLPTALKVDLAEQISLQSEADSKAPVYVVYPVKSSPMKLDIMPPTDAGDPIVIGHRGEQSPLPPSKMGSISPGTEYQNTPFSVVSHFEQEPILMAKNKQQNKNNFPYFLEKPAPVSFAEKESHLKNEQLNESAKEDIYNIGEEPVDQVSGDETYQISSKLTKVTERPIAIAYTPTEPNHNYKFNKPNNNYYYQSYDDERFSMPNYGGPVIKEIRDGETQTEISYLRGELDDLGYPLRGEHYEQNFQAPFHASVSIDGNKVTNAYEGWAVVTSSPQAVKQPESNIIDRSDTNIDQNDEKIVDELNEGEETTTKRFDMNSFQPEYLSGFRPIYSDDAKSTAHLHNAETPITTHLHAIAPPSEVKQEEIIEQKKLSTIEMDSLERFFDEMAKEYDDNLDDISLDDDNNEENSTNNIVGSSSRSKDDSN